MRLTIIAAALLVALAACSSGSRQSPNTAAASGTSTPAMSEAQVRQDLRDHGYSDVANLHQSQNGWTGSGVDSSGSPVNFGVDDAGVIVILQ